jgi:branched-chain amino acid transport system substrate-binding protein
MTKKPFEGTRVSRRTLLQGSAGLIGGTMLSGGMTLPARAADQPPVGTWPAGSQGNTVFIGASVPRTGTYAVQGEDELKGYQLAIEHINEGNDLVKQLSPKTKKGVLGKQLELGVADSAAKPNDAVQAQQRFISENKAVMITGGTSSAVAVALNKLACAASPARTTPPARIAYATASARVSSARPRLPQSPRFSSRSSARTRRWRT